MGSNEPYTDDAPVSATGQNEAHWRLYRAAGLNTIRQLQDRSITLSADGGEWAEAYPISSLTISASAAGRLGSVDTGLSTAPFGGGVYSTLYTPSDISGDTNSTSGDGGTNAANAFDDNINTYAGGTSLGTGSQTSTCGKTFAPKNIDCVYYSAQASMSAFSTRVMRIRLESYNGTTWDVEKTLHYTSSGATNTGKLTGCFNLNKTVQGIRIEIYSNATNGVHKYYEINYNGTPLTSEITHNIPSGTFSSTISSAYTTSLVEGWETGAGIQYKLTNATEDTGWLDYNVVSAFTAFTSEPTKLLTQLNPKSSSPINGITIKGIYLNGWSN